MKRGIDTFQTVKTEGSILPADLMLRLVDGNQDISGLRPEDYHLTKSERLNEASSRAWNRLQGAWEGFKDAMDALLESDVGTSLTREKWLLILFQELGYGRLTTRKAYEIEGQTYPVSHEWQNTPIHLVSFRQDLDKRTPGRAGATRVSPHSLVQEFLNRSEDHLWGFVSNGMNLRLLRDNVSLTRQAYVEFDLQAMMDSEAYSDFFLLYLLCHQSRVEVPEGKDPAHCWLEKWYNTAAQQGVRALEQLRNGVQRSIEALGGGFLAYPGNTALREKLRSGALNTQDYYRQVLRQVYRLLFLFVAEDRELLSDPCAPPEARKLYLDHYSTQRLRSLAGKKRGTRHPDLWHALRLVLEKLHRGCSQLALPALGSYLFSTEATTELNDQDIANKDLLKAIRALAFTVGRDVLRPVNYRNLGPEELGSVYESLLEMHPTIHIAATIPEDRFRLTVAAGSERKTTGSYYTPTSLVNCLLDSALDPVLDEACNTPDSEKAVLSLKVCDPACGSGHFLIAAAHRIAKRLAAIRSGEDEPAPEYYQHALRDVIGHCIYGVDINPMSVELCKVSLWMEAMEPGKPLAFLDHHIKCGNSLLGTTPALLKKGIPDNAFKPIEGDDKSVCSGLKKRNKEERHGQHNMFTQAEAAWNYRKAFEQATRQIERIPDDNLQTVEKKQAAYEAFLNSMSYISAKHLYDAWYAAFVCEKREGAVTITQQIISQMQDDPNRCPVHVQTLFDQLARQYQFFHWHLEFPDVFKPKDRDEIAEDEVTGWLGGFDCVLGNPPWERIKLQEKEFFASLAPEIANARNAAARRQLIDKLTETNPVLHQLFQDVKRKAEGESHLVRDTGRYPLCGRGDVNTYSIFAELKRSLLNPTGHVGCIVPSGIATDDTTKFFFQDLMDKDSLVSLYSFENEEFIFPAIHHATKFCLLTMAAPGSETRRIVDFVFFARQTEHLVEAERHFTLTADDIALLNPNTRTCPIFRSKQDAEITKHIYRRIPILFRKAREDQTEENPWGIKFSTMFHMANDSGLFRTLEQLEAEGFVLNGNIFIRGGDTYLPLYEAKMVHHFDHRWGTYEGQTEAQANQGKLPELTPEQHADSDFLSMPRYWVKSTEVHIQSRGWSHTWLFGFRNITGATVVRTIIAAPIPFVAVGHSMPLIFPSLRANHCAPLIALLASFSTDYAMRQKLGGINLTFGYFNQLPTPIPTDFKYPCPWSPGPNTLGQWMLSRVLELTYTAWDLEPFAQDCDYDGSPFKWDEGRRFLIRCELDSAFFHLYLGDEHEWKKHGSKDLLEYFPTPHHAVEYIMNTFRILREREEAAHGSFKTKDTILEIYDEMAELIQQNTAAVATGRQLTARFQSRLDPLPGPPMDAEGNFIPMAQWDRANWPSHIHLPREEVITRLEEVPLEEFAAMAYPGTDTDKSICAAALATVEQSPGLSSMDHLDVLLLATHPAWCKAFLGQEDLAAFETERRSAPGALFVGPDQPIYWKDCRNYLEQHKALNIAHGDQGQPIKAGSDFASTKANLPQGVDAVVKYALRAQGHIHKLRKDLSAVSQAQRFILDAFEEQHRLNDLAA